MDRKTDERREDDKEQRPASYDQIAQAIDNEHKKSTDAIERLIEIRSPFGKTNAVLKIMKAHITISTSNTKLLIKAMFSIDDLQKRLENLENIIRHMTEKPDVDLSSIKSEIATLKKQQLPKPVLKYIEEFRKEWESAQNKRAKWFP